MNIIVPQGEYNSVTSPDTISSGGFCTCFVTGVWDRKLKKAHILHDDAPFMHQDLPKFLDMILAESNAVDLTIKVYGGGENELLEDNYVAENREYVQCIFKQYKLTPLEIQFFDSIEGAELIITESGEFILNPV